jgi:hypothetical protein
VHRGNIAPPTDFTFSLRLIKLQRDNFLHQCIVVMMLEKEKVMLYRCQGNNAINGAPNGDTVLSAIHVDFLPLSRRNTQNPWDYKAQRHRARNTPCIFIPMIIIFKDTWFSDRRLYKSGIADRLPPGLSKPVPKRGSLYLHSPEPGQLPGTLLRSRILQGREYGGTL